MRMNQKEGWSCNSGKKMLWDEGENAPKQGMQDIEVIQKDLASDGMSRPSKRNLYPPLMANYSLN